MILKTIIERDLFHTIGISCVRKRFMGWNTMSENDFAGMIAACGTGQGAFRQYASQELFLAVVLFYHLLI